MKTSVSIGDNDESDKLQQHNGTLDKQNQKNEEKEESSFYKNMMQFAENTTVHGIPRVVTSQSSHRRVLWTCFLLGTFGYLLYQLYTIGIYYSSRPIKTTVQLHFQPLHFPAITLCNLNSVRKSKVGQLGTKTMRLLSASRRDGIQKDFVFSYPSLASDGSTQENSLVEELRNMESRIYDNSYLVKKINNDYSRLFSTPVKFNIGYLLKQKVEYDYVTLNRSARRDLGHQAENMVLDCSFAGRECYRHDSVILTAEYGNCYTYQSQQYISTKSGPQYGLEIVLNLENHEVLSQMSRGYGARLVIHEPGSFPLPAQEGITISPGYETSLGIRLTKINRLPDPYGKCMKQLRDIYPNKGVKYSTQACLLYCKDDLILNKCGCSMASIKAEIWRHFGYEPEDHADCRNNANMTYCAHEAINAFLDHSDTCDCYKQCDESAFGTSFSGRLWPSQEYLEVLREEACKTYDTSNTTCPLMDLDVEKLKMNFLKINLYFEDLNFESLREEPLYDTSALLSDIGGSLGLFLGASVLSGCELVDVILECFISLNKRWKKKKNAIKQKPK